MHTKIQGHQPFGSRGEYFLSFLTYTGMAAILVMWPGPFEQSFVPESHRSSIWNLTLIGPVVSEEKMFMECGRRCTTEAYLSYKLTKWAFGSGELKMKWIINDFWKLSLSNIPSAIKSNEPRHDKMNKMSVRPAKTHISLGNCPVWSESSLSAWRKPGSLTTHWAHSEDYDQTGRMPRLIWVFAGRTLILLVLSCRGSNPMPYRHLAYGNLGHLMMLHGFTKHRILGLPRGHQAEIREQVSHVTRQFVFGEDSKRPAQL